jgi:hypothetical protein
MTCKVPLLQHLRFLSNEPVSISWFAERKSQHEVGQNIETAIVLTKHQPAKRTASSLVSVVVGLSSADSGYARFLLPVGASVEDGILAATFS